MKKLYLPILLAAIAALILLRYYLVQGAILAVESYGREYSIFWQPWVEPHNAWMPELNNLWNVLAIFVLVFSSTTMLKSLDFSAAKTWALIIPPVLMVLLLLLIRSEAEPWSSGGKLATFFFWFFFIFVGYKIVDKPGLTAEEKEKETAEWGPAKEIAAGALITGQIFIVWLMIFKEPFLEGQALIASYFITAIGIGFLFGLLRSLCVLAVTWMFRGLKYYE